MRPYCVAIRHFLDCHDNYKRSLMIWTWRDGPIGKGAVFTNKTTLFPPVGGHSLQKGDHPQFTPI